MAIDMRALNGQYLVLFLISMIKIIPAGIAQSEINPSVGESKGFGRVCYESMWPVVLNYFM